MTATASMVGGGGTIRGPPGAGSTNGSGSTNSHGGQGAVGGASLPAGTIVFLRPSGGNADGPAEDLYGDPLFDTIIDILKGALIPGYDLYLLYKNPAATWVDWAEAIASTAVSLTPFKAAQLAVKVFKSVQKARKFRRLEGAIQSLCCFAAGTPVKTAEGSKPIETLKVGDLVLARDEKTGETAYKPITHLFINDQMTVWNLEVVDATGAVETHRVTNNHPYAVVGTGWVQVADLQPGMVLETEGGSPVTVLRVQDTGVIERTYNLEVADFHTFFVGNQFVLVHNECKLPDLNVNQAAKALRPEKGYLGSKKHGLNWKEGPATAKSVGKPQGQWGSQADLDLAAEKASTLKPGQGEFFDLPAGTKSVVHRPDGTTVPATRMWVRNNGTGTFHGAPWE